MANDKITGEPLWKVQAIRRIWPCLFYFSAFALLILLYLPRFRKPFLKKNARPIQLKRAWKKQLHYRNVQKSIILFRSHSRPGMFRALQNEADEAIRIHDNPVIMPPAVEK